MRIGCTVTLTKRSVIARKTDMRMDFSDRRLSLSSTTQMIKKFMANITGMAMQWTARRVVQVALAELGKLTRVDTSEDL